MLLFISIYLFISVCVWSIEFCRKMCYFLFLFIYLFQAVYGVLSSIEGCAAFYFYLFISVCVWSIQFCRRMCYFLFLFIYLFQAVYGVFSSIEGCAAFQDCLRLTKIGKWYYRMKDACDNHHGNLSSHKQ